MKYLFLFFSELSNCLRREYHHIPCMYGENGSRNTNDKLYV